MNHLEAHDFVIVGAGSAGCVLAARLSEDPRCRVLLLEAGPPPRSPWIGIPAGLPRLLGNSPYNWPDKTVPIPQLGNREVWIGHGRTLGGSSAINGMVYNRSEPGDFDRWRHYGVEGWEWQDVRPCFEYIEQVLSPAPPTYWHPSMAAFVVSATSLSDPELGRYTGGPDLFRMTIANGRRRSSYDAFLKPVKDRPNLTIVTGALVTRVLVTDGAASGVEFLDHGMTCRIDASREVILCAGAIDTPRLLMLSGIGPGGHLRDLGISVCRDLPGVGANLQDHLATGVVVSTSPAGSINGRIAGGMQLLQGLRYLLTGGGPVTLGSSSAGCFLRLNANETRSQVQFSFRPFSVSRTSRAAYRIDDKPAISASAAWLHPYSRGTVSLNSPDFSQRPKIDPAYLSDDRDVEGMIKAARMLAAVFRTEVMDNMVEADSLPGDRTQTDEQVLAHVRGSASSMSHQVGTCRMGDGHDAVVDSRLNVHGLSRLRIADASIMPELPSANTNATAIMIGARAAQMMVAEYRLVTRTP